MAFRTEMDPAGYHQAISRAIRLANFERMREDPPRAMIPHWFPYQIRHAVGTTIGDEFDSEHAAAILGHSGMDSIQTYMQQQIGKAARVAAQLG